MKMKRFFPKDNNFLLLDDQNSPKDNNFFLLDDQNLPEDNNFLLLDDLFLPKPKITDMLYRKYVKIVMER